MPRIPSCLFALLACGLAACASAENDQAMAAQEADAWYSSLEDAGAGGQKESQESDAVPISLGDAGPVLVPDGDVQSGATPPGAGGIGLKPGGPQNIAVFRAKIAAGQVPQATDMTIVGWLNEHGTPLPPADPSRPVDLHALAGLLQDGTAGQPPEVVLQLGFNTTKSLQELQPALALAVVVDRSGSMQGEPLERARKGLLQLVDHLPAGSAVAVVSFGDEATVDWPAKAWTSANRQALEDTLGTWQAGGGTNLHAGLQAGLDAVAQVPGSFGARRVLLVSDGAATVGTTGAGALAALGQAAKAQQVGVSTLAYGVAASLPALMQLANATGGVHYEVTTPDALELAFVQDLQTLLVPVAEDLQIRVTPAPGWALAEAYGFALTQASDGSVQLDDLDTAVPPGGDAAGADTGGGQDGAAAPDGGTQPQGKSVLSTLYAAEGSGIVLLRLQPPAGVTEADLLQLQLATVDYGYVLAQDGQPRQHQVHAQVPGLVQIPDGGYGYFADPAVRRAFVLLQLGRAMQQAAGLYHAGKAADAQAVLTAVLQFAGQQLGELQLPQDDPDGSLEAGKGLVGQLLANMG